MICPITYQDSGNFKYSLEGLRLLNKNLSDLNDFPYNSEEQREESMNLATKISIQGVQPKLSVILNSKKEIFEITGINGQYILKPQHHIYRELPENEDLTMRLASIVGIEVPLHGLIYCKDGSFSYFIKRFDRVDKNKKLAVEDFSQLAGMIRDTKYDYSMEKIIKLIDSYCTFPALDKLKLFKLTIFNFLVGNEDMHLKNFSIITRGKKVELSPSYDLLNTTIVIKRSKEEIALPISGKKNNLNYHDLVNYFGLEKLSISEKSINQFFEILEKELPKWKATIAKSFLSPEMKNKYLDLLCNRLTRLKIKP